MIVLFTCEDTVTADTAQTPADNIAHYPGAARERLRQLVAFTQAQKG